MSTSAGSCRRRHRLLATTAVVASAGAGGERGDTVTGVAGGDAVEQRWRLGVYGDSAYGTGAACPPTAPRATTP